MTAYSNKELQAMAVDILRSQRRARPKEKLTLKSWTVVIDRENTHLAVWIRSNNPYGAALETRHNVAI